MTNYFKHDFSLLFLPCGGILCNVWQYAAIASIIYKSMVAYCLCCTGGTPPNSFPRRLRILIKRTFRTMRSLIHTFAIPGRGTMFFSFHLSFAFFGKLRATERSARLRFHIFILCLAILHFACYVIKRPAPRMAQ